MEWRVNAIMRRQNRESKFHASIHGIDINPVTDSDTREVELSEAQKTAVERQKQAALARIKNRNG